ncbi:MAG: helix-turn-helix transcriptional regulator [Proteobacteria bacterium]|nr:helix-turn-helix transcriptional regulator [Pseudomonadota bacterium]MDE3207711.1 helix-turn-helix transcriptional regulator [Pseudomonadota bacterium]
MYRLLGILAGPWTLYIMWVLLNSGPTRFGELKRLIEGISSKMLTERLRLLENEGFIYRHYEPTVPPQVTYGPTDRVTEILPALRQLCELASKWYSPSDFIHPQEPLQDSEKIQTKMTV